MTVKEFRRRWLNSKIEPELFYLPFKHKQKKKVKLTIQTHLYNTLNLETMEYSNTEGYLGDMVRTHIIILDANGNVFFNSKKQQSYPSTSFILNEVPYGIYQIKIIYASDGGVVDNIFHEIIINDGDEVNYKIYLKYRWNTEVLQLINETPECYIGGYSNHYKDKPPLLTPNIITYWSCINIYDETNQELICTVPYKNIFNTILQVGTQDQLYGNVYGYLYTNKVWGDVTCTYEYVWKHRKWIDAEHVAKCDVITQGNISYEIINNPYVITHNNESYEEYFPDYNNNYSNRVRYIISEEKNTFNFTTIPVVVTDETNESYVNIAINQSELVNSVSEALSYYANYLNTVDEINKSFFSAGNFLICKNDNNIYFSITTWEKYQEYQNNTDVIIVKQCAKYDTNKYYFASGISYNNFWYQGLYNRNKKNFNIICPEINSPITILTNTSNNIVGYIKYGEDTKDKIIRHVINDSLPSYSDDFDKY